MLSNLTEGLNIGPLTIVLIKLKIIQFLTFNNGCTSAFLSMTNQTKNTTRNIYLKHMSQGVQPEWLLKEEWSM